MTVHTFVIGVNEAIGSGGDSGRLRRRALFEGERLPLTFLN